MIKKNPSFINYPRLLTLIFGLLSLGALGETRRVFTSNAPDIAQNRSGLIPMSLIMTSLFIFLTIYFWRKSKKH